MFSFFKRKRNKRFNQESHDKAKENQAVSERKLDLENDEANVDSEQILHFDHLNFKLAVIQVLMYDLEVLEPSFDIYDFAEEMYVTESTVHRDIDKLEKNLGQFNLKIRIKHDQLFVDGDEF